MHVLSSAILALYGLPFCTIVCKSDLVFLYKVYHITVHHGKQMVIGDSVKANTLKHKSKVFGLVMKHEMVKLYECGVSIADIKNEVMLAESML